MTLPGVFRGGCGSAAGFRAILIRATREGSGAYQQATLKIAALPAMPRGCAPTSQPWRFISSELGIISAEQQAFQALSIRQDRSRNPLPLETKELRQPIDCDDHIAVN